MREKYKVVLYYKYVPIENRDKLRDEQMSLCRELGLRGRIIVSDEGINGTFEGLESDCNKYIEKMKSDPRFSDIHWKISNGTEDGTAFPKLSVKSRSEIVSLHLGKENDINPNEITGKHLKPEELREWYENKKEFYIVDMRNDYELKVGQFKNTIFPGMKNFRDLRYRFQSLKSLKEKPVLTVCTGGVRCEKASGLLKREGFKNIYQLDGGIVNYMEKYPGQDFDGSLYVFDKRITMHFNNEDNHKIIGKCEKCSMPTESYRNCRSMYCHRHFVCCDNCLENNGDAFCNIKCKILSWWFDLTHKKKKVYAK